MKTILLSIALLPFLLPAADAQTEGKIDWKGKDAASIRGTMEGITREHRPMMLFFTSEGSAECRTLAAGAFSDAQVIDAASKVACVYVECAGGKKNADLMKSLNITRVPAIFFIDADGNPLGNVPARDAAGIVKALGLLVQVAEKLPGFPEDPDGAVQAGRTKSLPVLVYFYDESPASLAVNRSLTDDELKPLRNKFLFSRCALKKGSELCAKYDVDRAPTILVLDPASQNPESKPLARINGSRSPRELRRDLDDALAAPRGGGAPSGGAGALPLPSGTPKEPLSDDELDRKFIQARVSVANGLVKDAKVKEAIKVLEDVVQTYPKHVATLEARKLLEKLQK